VNRVTVEYGDVNRLIADLHDAPAKVLRQASTAIRKTALVGYLDQRTPGLHGTRVRPPCRRPGPNPRADRG